MVNLHELLERTSRTFALAIPVLQEPLRRHVGLAYLLFRIADTLEDATSWSQAERVEALGDFASLLRAPLAGGRRELAERWIEGPPCPHAGYLGLLRALPQVLDALVEMPHATREIVTSHLLRTVHGMVAFVQRGRADGSLALSDEADLLDYCYVVAGIVGEMLTEMFLEAEPVLGSHSGPLRRTARQFGEGLQLVNILRDAGEDAQAGRVYIGRGVARPQVMARARRDLREAEAYVETLRQAGASREILAFCLIPLRLASATLLAVDQDGPGAKVSRAAVGRIIASVNVEVAEEAITA
ncbi:MAG: squalene/phytoene synthase family protein [Polyangiaceae bacterium]